MRIKLRLSWGPIDPKMELTVKMDAAITVFNEVDKFGCRAVIHSHACVPDSEPHYRWVPGVVVDTEYGDKKEGFLYENWSEI